MTQLYMLDTNIGSFVMRERPAAVLAKLQAWVDSRQRIVISAVTYAAMRFGSIGKNISKARCFGIGLCCPARRRIAMGCGSCRRDYTGARRARPTGDFDRRQRRGDRWPRTCHRCHPGYQQRSRVPARAGTSNRRLGGPRSMRDNGAKNVAASPFISEY